MHNIYCLGLVRVVHGLQGVKNQAVRALPSTSYGDLSFEVFYANDRIVIKSYRHIVTLYKALVA